MPAYWGKFGFFRDPFGMRTASSRDWKQKGMLGTFVGIPELEEFLQKPQESTVLFAKSGSGKTTWCLYLEESLRNNRQQLPKSAAIVLNDFSNVSSQDSDQILKNFQNLLVKVAQDSLGSHELSGKQSWQEFTQSRSIHSLREVLRSIADYFAYRGEYKCIHILIDNFEQLRKEDRERLLDDLWKFDVFTADSRVSWNFFLDEDSRPFFEKMQAQKMTFKSKTVVWDKELLTELLNGRIRWATKNLDYDYKILFDQTFLDKVFGYQENPIDRLCNIALGSGYGEPRFLLELSENLLEGCESEKIEQEDWERFVAQKFANNIPSTAPEFFECVWQIIEKRVVQSKYLTKLWPVMDKTLDKILPSSISGAYIVSGIIPILAIVADLASIINVPHDFLRFFVLFLLAVMGILFFVYSLRVECKDKYSGTDRKTLFVLITLPVLILTIFGLRSFLFWMCNIQMP